MLATTTTAVIRRQVAWRFDCEPGDLLGAAPRVQAHGQYFAGYHGIYVWLMDELAIVSVPPEWVSVARSAVTGQASWTLGNPDFWQTVVGGAGARIERFVGPSYQGYADAAAFRPAPPGTAAPQPFHVRVLDPLQPADVSALAALAAVCSPEEWRHSAIQPQHTPIVVAEHAGALLAAASAPDDGPGVASVGVITHPAWRGRGYGQAVVSALTANRLATGLVLHYQTLRFNVASVGVARALGYHDLATALAIRLQREAARDDR